MLVHSFEKLFVHREVEYRLARGRTNLALLLVCKESVVRSGSSLTEHLGRAHLANRVAAALEDERKAIVRVERFVAIVAIKAQFHYFELVCKAPFI